MDKQLKELQKQIKSVRDEAEKLKGVPTPKGRQEIAQACIHLEEAENSILQAIEQVEIAQQEEVRRLEEKEKADKADKEQQELEAKKRGGDIDDKRTEKGKN